MFTVKKKLSFSAAHKLNLPYESKCTNLHGHEWHAEIYVQSKELNENGMVVDFSYIKKKIVSVLDHKYLNEIFDFNPTAENIAKWISDQLTNDKITCFRVELAESNNNIVIYTRD